MNINVRLYAYVCLLLESIFKKRDYERKTGENKKCSVQYVLIGYYFILP